MRLVTHIPAPLHLVYNGGCLTCGANVWPDEAKPVSENAINLEVEDRVDGAFYLCTRCAKQIALLIGYRPAHEAYAALEAAEREHAAAATERYDAEADRQRAEAERKAVEDFMARVQVAHDNERAKAKPATLRASKAKAST